MQHNKSKTLYFASSKTQSPNEADTQASIIWGNVHSIFLNEHFFKGMRNDSKV